MIWRDYRANLVIATRIFGRRAMREILNATHTRGVICRNKVLLSVSRLTNGRTDPKCDVTAHDYQRRAVSCEHEER